MKKLAFIIFVSALAACRPSGALSPEERERLDLEVGAAATDIYGEVCRWYNAHGDSYGEGQDFDRRFLTPGLYSIRQEAGGLGVATNEPPSAMDYDHWVQAQDWEAVEAVVDSVNVLTRDAALVFLTLSNGPGTLPFALLMKKAHSERRADGSAWLIDDFIGRDGRGYSFASSERKVLQEFIATHSPTANDARLQAQVKERVLSLFAEMIAACREAKAAGKTPDLYVFNTSRFLTNDYMLWYARVDSIDRQKDIGDTFFFNTEHWGLNLEQDAIREVEVLRVTATEAPSPQTAAQADAVVRLTCEDSSYSSNGTTSHSIVHLRLARERGGWYVDDFFYGYPPTSEKEVMKEYVLRP